MSCLVMNKLALYGAVVISDMGLCLCSPQCLIALDERGYRVNIWLLLHENICCGYSLEAPQGGTANKSYSICFHAKIRKYLILIFA